MPKTIPVLINAFHLFIKIVSAKVKEIVASINRIIALVIKILDSSNIIFYLKGVNYIK